MKKAVLRRSERIYGFILKFYPKRYRQEFEEEMKYVFSESVKDAYTDNGEQGVIMLWGRTVLDTGKSIFIQHIEDRKGGDFMATKSKDIIMQNKIFLWIALGAVLLLTVPLMLTIRDGNVEGVGWNWSWPGDYVFGFVMIFGFSSLFIFAARKWQKNRVIVALIVAAVFLYLWAEFAVGIFTNWGS